MMLGDGLNDAGALVQSDVGIAISENINVFSPACDGILDARSFSKLPVLSQTLQKNDVNHQDQLRDFFPLQHHRVALRHHG